MKLKWVGSGSGAGYYIDLYETEDGRRIVIGSEREDDEPLRKEIVDAFNQQLARSPDEDKR